MDRNLRLRLVVRRHGLPEARILFNVPLDNDPTVAQLVELVNESIPLENDEWGLDDYTVELRAKDGHAFECMHFQPVASILDKDDEVLYVLYCRSTPLRPDRDLILIVVLQHPTTPDQRSEKKANQW